jgi:hypothetical protein
MVDGLALFLAVGVVAMVWAVEVVLIPGEIRQPRQWRRWWASCSSWSTVEVSYPSLPPLNTRENPKSVGFGASDTMVDGLALFLVVGVVAMVWAVEVVLSSTVCLIQSLWLLAVCLLHLLGSEVAGWQEHGASPLQAMLRGSALSPLVSFTFLFSILALQLLLFVIGSMVTGKASRGVLDAAIGWALLLAQFGSLVPGPCSALGERVSMGGSTALFEPGRGGRGPSPAMEVYV